MDRQTDVQTDRCTDRQMYRQTDVQTDRCTDRQMYRQTDVQTKYEEGCKNRPNGRNIDNLRD